ncbi:FKBP-rapamycin associated protein [Culex quinquefasciatus]|uniref:FKBP-rapamycin associated protein n=1 Tax=Culex quinquefasciatus TaxID=7176 RepID=B0X2F8_CULQU|nr:FKBP-rapamycin associated protein [Culex quinquefasciatus]|eukprot:XP_001863830.1 FKBP-rapamycin associated protein [Culex quinquefasciatus]
MRLLPARLQQHQPEPDSKAESVWSEFKVMGGARQRRIEQGESRRWEAYAIRKKCTRRVSQFTKASTSWRKRRVICSLWNSQRWWCGGARMYSASG